MDSEIVPVIVLVVVLTVDGPLDFFWPQGEIPFYSTVNIRQQEHTLTTYNDRQQNKLGPVQ